MNGTIKEETMDLLVDWYELVRPSWWSAGMHEALSRTLRARGERLGLEWGQVCTAAGLTDHWVEVVLSEEEQTQAMDLAESRLTDGELSPTRPSASSLASQHRGAVGEMATAKWLRDEGHAVEECFCVDQIEKPDIIVNGLGIEVMTAQAHHREMTGFCVPPNKLWAARQRDAIGYLFVAMPVEEYATTAWIQAFAYTAEVDVDPPVETSVRPGGTGVMNYMIRPENLYSPEHLFGLLSERPR